MPAIVDIFISAFEGLEQHVLNPITAPLAGTWLGSLGNPKTFLAVEPSPHALKFPIMNPLHVVLLIGLYLATIWVGIQLMRNQEKFTMKGFAFFHNTFLVALSFYMCTGTLYEAYKANYILFGNAVDSTASGFTVMKYIDFCV
jgi:hypothetical protein